MTCNGVAVAQVEIGVLVTKAIGAINPEGEGAIHKLSAILR